MADSPSIPSPRRLKRRSSSMCNLVEQNMVEKDMVTSKLNLIRRKNLARRNFRTNQLTDLRAIDSVEVMEETPMVARKMEPKIELVELEATSTVLTERVQLKYEIDEIDQTLETNSKITIIKKPLSRFKNYVKNIIGVSKKMPAVDGLVKQEPITPLVEPHKFLDLDKINEQHKRLATSQPPKLGRFNSASNFNADNNKPTVPIKPAAMGQNMNAVNTNANFKRSLRNYDSCTSLKPIFKLSSKIQYNDSHLFATNPQPCRNAEIEKFNKLILKRKIAPNMHGSLCSLNSIKFN